ncbi:sensor histidine kinase, partial [Klebsiella variicola]|uniref:sensor histidine kinase n=1 Tax=Klebsiella variicola TaxID=244366 RepID=UPI002730797F
VIDKASEDPLYRDHHTPRMYRFESYISVPVFRTDGPGIDEAELGRLFERFYSRGNANGAGLGLAIVEMIVGKIGCRL